MQQAALYGMEKDMVGVRRALCDEFGVRIYVVSRVHEQTTFESTDATERCGACCDLSLCR